VSLKIILTVKRVFKHFSDTSWLSNQALGWPIYTRSAAGKLVWKCSHSGQRACDKLHGRIGKAGLATRDATGHVSRLASPCMLVSCSQHPTAISRDGLTSLRVPLTSSRSRQLRLSPYCIPVLVATGVVLRQQQFVTISEFIGYLRWLRAQLREQPDTRKKKLAGYIHPPIPKRPGPDEQGHVAGFLVLPW
jgi:hypothetical protein